MAHFQAAKSCFRKYGSVSQPSLCTISNKTNDQILRKLGDRRTGERTNGPTDESNFIGRCPTNVEHPISHENILKKTIATKVKTTFLALILTLSNFIFNKKHFLQIKGSAIGSVHHPMQMYFWIINIFQTHQPYILDLDRHSDEFYQFSKHLSRKHLSIKFDYKALKNRIIFLDTEICIHNSKLHAKIYRKETDQQHHLYIKSEHLIEIHFTLQSNQLNQVNNSKSCRFK